MATLTFHSLMLHELSDLLDAEKQLVKALPKMHKAASNADLKKGFAEHLAQTKEQVRRIEHAFKLLGEKPMKISCDGMKGLIKEGEALIKKKSKKQDPDVLDAGLIGAAQRVEHYEIAAYGTARAFAEEMGHTQVADLLQKTLDEEAATDEKLNKLALTKVNPSAMENASGMEEEQRTKKGSTIRRALSRMAVAA